MKKNILLSVLVLASVFFMSSIAQAEDGVISSFKLTAPKEDIVINKITLSPEDQKKLNPDQSNIKLITPDKKDSTTSGESSGSKSIIVNPGGGSTSDTTTIIPGISVHGQSQIFVGGPGAVSAGGSSKKNNDSTSSSDVSHFDTSTSQPITSSPEVKPTPRIEVLPQTSPERKIESKDDLKEGNAQKVNGVNEERSIKTDSPVSKNQLPINREEDTKKEGDVVPKVFHFDVVKSIQKNEVLNSAEVNKKLVTGVKKIPQAMTQKSSEKKPEPVVQIQKKIVPISSNSAESKKKDKPRPVQTAVKKNIPQKKTSSETGAK